MNGGEEWLPFCIYSKGELTENMSPCYWSDYYASNPRTPDVTELAPWVARFYGQLQQPLKKNLVPRPSQFFCTIRVCNLQPNFLYSHDFDICFPSAMSFIHFCYHHSYRVFLLLKKCILQTPLPYSQRSLILVIAFQHQGC